MTSFNQDQTSISSSFIPPSSPSSMSLSLSLSLSAPLSTLALALVGTSRVTPYGRAALCQLNRQASEDESDAISSRPSSGAGMGDAAAAEFPDERILIPTHLTPINIHKYNYYEILGFNGEWADSADTEAIRRAYHKAVLLYHPDKSKKKSLKTDSEDRSVNWQTAILVYILYCNP